MFAYTPENVYRLDRAAVDIDGLTEIELMGRAGLCVLDAVLERWPGLTTMTVLAGPGNNGGDAFVVALEARSRGIQVQCLTMGNLSRQSETAQHYCRQWQQDGGETESWEGQPVRGEVVVDGLLGIGLQRDLDQSWQSLISAVNATGLPRIAIDIPSGLNGLNGQAQPVAVRADLTITFIGVKTGHYLADGPDYCGDMVFNDLGVSNRALASVPPDLDAIESCRLPAQRLKNSHKNMFGHVLVVGGDLGMSGAVTLASKAALRAGAGLVTALVHPQCRHHLASVPEVMVQDWSALESRLESATIVVAGPGLGDSEAAAQCLDQLSRSDLPMVVDASALDRDFLDALGDRQLVITPHPGEAGRLLSRSTSAVQADRVGSCIELSERFNATCVLKGSGTLIAAPDCLTVINTGGNPGMAAAGMGDVLAGIIAALMGQGMKPFDAATAGVFLHAGSADCYAIESDQVGLVASDLIDFLPRAMKFVRDSV